jgi:hypothetical protein
VAEGREFSAGLGVTNVRHPVFTVCPTF